MLSFEEWAKQNPTKSINDFYLEMAQPAAPQTEPYYYNRPTRSNTFWIVAFSVVAALAAILGTLLWVRATPQVANTLALAANDPHSKVVPLYTANDVAKEVKIEKGRSELKLGWRELVTVERSGGQQLGLVGGFENVKINVSNESDYMLDEVTILIRLNKGLLGQRFCHEEYLTFYNVGSHQNQKQSYTHTECGQTLEVQVMGFKCNELRYTMNAPEL